jgi:predicted ATP-grasp superfamily ATP-dependent carboligase
MARIGNESMPGAVVIGGDYQGLGIVRSLGRLGIPVCVIDDERSIARRSRYATVSVHVPSLSDEEPIVDALLAAAKRHSLEGWILFPTRDEVVAAISRHREALTAQFRVPTPSWESIRWAADKRNTYELAVELGIPTPWTAWPEDEEALDALDVRLPTVVKPAVKGRFLKATGAKAWRVDSRAELVARFRQAQQIVPDGEVMLQELIPGGGERQYAYCVLFKDGAALASMNARRRRQHPWEFGRASTFVETIDECGLEAHSLRFLSRIGYYGLVELEYKHDLRDNAFKLLDVNARTWGYHTLGAAAGVDFPALLYQDQVGEEISLQRAQAGVNWLRILTDLPTGILDIRARRTSLGAYLRSLRAADTEAVWDRRDLRPWLAELMLIPYLIAKRGF